VLYYLLKYVREGIGTGNGRNLGEGTGTGREFNARLGLGSECPKLRGKLCMYILIAEAVRAF
jgi:hypothetical protein